LKRGGGKVEKLRHHLLDKKISKRRNLTKPNKDQASAEKKRGQRNKEWGVSIQSKGEATKLKKVLGESQVRGGKKS